MLALNAKVGESCKEVDDRTLLRSRDEVSSEAGAELYFFQMITALWNAFIACFSSFVVCYLRLWRLYIFPL